MKDNTPRLKEAYKKTIAPEIMKKFSLENIHQVPSLEKIVLNIGLTEAKDNVKVVDIAMSEISAITGQKPRVCRAKKSISNFLHFFQVPIGQ